MYFTCHYLQESEMINYTKQDLVNIANKLLEMDPDPVPHFRLLRDILKVDQESRSYIEAKAAVQQSKWVRLLQDSQLDDGTWGRFHTQNTRVKQTFPTTETAIATALACGLDKDSDLLKATVSFILDHLDGKTTWTDPPEKHDNPDAWPVGIRHISAANLALIDNAHPYLDEFWTYWVKTASAAFASGQYDRKAEIQTRNDLDNIKRKNPGAFHTKYHLILLSSTAKTLPINLERLILDYVMDAPHGIYYTYEKHINIFPAIHARWFVSWLLAHKLLSRFPTWRKVGSPALNWIWDQRSPEGFWNFTGYRPWKPVSYLPVSENWRKRKNRVIDCTLLALDVLMTYFDT
jgi:hypothetical protein